jgi:hypothetical protein
MVLILIVGFKAYNSAILQKSLIFKVEKYFDFQKWTKINVQILIAKTLLLTKNFSLIIKNYRHNLNDKFLFYDDNFFVK